MEAEEQQEEVREADNDVVEAENDVAEIEAQEENMNEVSPMEEPTIERRAVATAEENSNFDQYSAIKQTKRLQNNLTGTLQSVHHTQT